jgi:hypothetical protein
MIDTNRRAFMAGSAIAAIAVAIPAAATTAPVDRRAWDFAMARLEATKAASDTYDANVFDPAYNREQAFEASHGLSHQFPDGSYTPNYHERRKALWDTHGKAHCLPDDISDEQERLVEVMCDAEFAVMQTPAPDTAALRWKLDKLFDTGTDPDRGTSAWSADYVAQTMADIARLLPEAR